MSDWQGVPDDIGKYVGFVYCITCKVTDRKYIGKCLYWSAIRRKPLKGYKRVRLDKVESKWKSYYGSSLELLEDVKKYGVDSFERVILMNCITKFDCAYYETKLQFDNNVLFSDEYYNKIINCRLKRG